ncbi:hypothetical protein CC78DRAFT_388846 [Lojkania enalia]|uniref:Uncharacterized protein n=1 Tax=Lojkania enalia TaxID=147567 RepID=A0A9P4K4B8_9PLEO|nr:hypothetical protein CC78DRAFT_388846 [Didymosphaeria enalia]
MANRRNENDIDGLPASQTATAYFSHGLPTPLTGATLTPLWSPLEAARSETTSNPASIKGKNKRTRSDTEKVDDEQAAAPKVIAGPQVIHRDHHRHPSPLWISTIPGLPDDPAPRTLGRPFNIFKAILRHPNLFFQFAMCLPPKAFMDLYAIDKEFHYRLNRYSVSIIHDYAQYHAPEAAHIFNWVFYHDLCISDPMLKPMDDRSHLARDIPSFRWVNMVLFRDEVVKEIVFRLALEGHRVPPGTNVTLMKFWLLMEQRYQMARQAFLRDRSVWTNGDIFRFHIFLIKLDMHFSCPVQGQGICALSHLLLTQKSLSRLRNLLVGEESMEYDDLEEMVIRTYLRSELDLEAHPGLNDEVENGIPEEEWGVLRREGWHWEGKPMRSAVDLVIFEGLRRQLHLERYLLDFVMCGFVYEDTGKNVPIPRKHFQDKGFFLPKEGRPQEEDIDMVTRKLDELCGMEK